MAGNSPFVLTPRRRWMAETQRLEGICFRSRDRVKTIDPDIFGKVVITVNTNAETAEPLQFFYYDALLSQAAQHGWRMFCASGPFEVYDDNSQGVLILDEAEAVSTGESDKTARELEQLRSLISERTARAPLLENLEQLHGSLGFDGARRMIEFVGNDDTTSPPGPDDYRDDD